MKLPELSKRQQELFHVVMDGSLLDYFKGGLGWIDAQVDIPENCNNSEYLHLAIHQLGLNKKLTALTNQLGFKDGLVDIKSFHLKYKGKIDEITAPIWMEPYCERIQHQIHNKELKNIINKHFDNKFPKIETIDCLIKFFKICFECNYKKFILFTKTVCHACGFEEMKKTLAILGEDQEIKANAVEVDEETVLDIPTELSSAELIELAAIALDNMHPKDFRRSLMKLEIKTSLINAGSDELKFNHLALKKSQSEHLLLNWLNNTATDPDQPLKFAGEYFKKLTGLEANTKYRKKAYTVSVPQTRKYTPLTTEQHSKLSDDFEMYITPSEFEWTSAMVHFNCAMYIHGQDCNYFNAVKELKNLGGRKYSYLIIDFLHVLASKNKYFAGKWLEELAIIDNKNEEKGKKKKGGILSRTIKKMM